jgi:hypothetical protein
MFLTVDDDPARPSISRSARPGGAWPGAAAQGSARAPRSLDGACGTAFQVAIRHLECSSARIATLNAVPPGVVTLNAMRGREGDSWHLARFGQGPPGAWLTFGESSPLNGCVRGVIVGMQASMIAFARMRSPRTWASRHLERKQSCQSWANAFGRMQSCLPVGHFSRSARQCLADFILYNIIYNIYIISTKRCLADFGRMSTTCVQPYNDC